MITISLGTAVFCESNQCGLLQHLIIQPPHFYLTHLVVKPVNQVDRLIPITHVTEISDDTIWLKDNMAQFNRLPTFTETTLSEMIEADYSFDEYGYWHPEISSQTKLYTPISQYNIPAGGVVIHRQTQVEARNGHVGQFKSLVIDKGNFQVIHFVFKRGHLWERKQETVPASVIDRVEGDTIYLKINKSDM